MKKIEIKNRFTNRVIFTYECENNTMKITVEQAVKNGASLNGASLDGASLDGAKNLDKTVKLPMYCKWTHGITNGNLIHIGCEKRNIEEWDLFFASDKIILTERNTPEFKQIQAVYEAYKSYLNFLSK